MVAILLQSIKIDYPKTSKGLLAYSHVSKSLFNFIIHRVMIIQFIYVDINFNLNYFVDTICFGQL